MANYNFYNFTSQDQLILDYGEEWPSKWNNKKVNSFDSKTNVFGDPTEAGFLENHLVALKFSNYGFSTKTTIHVNKIVYALLDSALKQIEKLGIYDIKICYGYLFRYKKNGTTRNAIYNNSYYDSAKKKYCAKYDKTGDEADKFWNITWAQFCAEYDRGNFTPDKLNLLSNHAFGTAIDINPSDNDVGSYTWDMPPEVVKIFLAHGFGWGGFYNGQTKSGKIFKDAMHFEYVLNGPLEVPAPLASYSLPIDLELNAAMNRNNIDKIYARTERMQTSGFFPVGANTIWHGGVHLEGELGVPVYAVAGGTIIAVRLEKKGNSNLKHGSRNFVLIKHKSEDDKIWYSLYMHLLSLKLDISDFRTKRLQWIIEEKPIPDSVEVKGGFVKRASASMDGPVIGSTSSGDIYQKLGIEGAWFNLKDNEDREFYVYRSGIVGPAVGSRKKLMDLSKLENGNVVKLNKQVVPGEVIGYMGAAGNNGNHSAKLHWEIISEELIGDGWKKLEDLDDNINCDSDAIIKLIDSDKFFKNQKLEKEEIIQFYQNEGQAEKARNMACKFHSEWAINWDKAVPKLEKSFRIANPNLSKELKLYNFWEEAKSAGADLPSKKVLYHYNPVRFLEKILPPEEAARQRVTNPKGTLPYQRGHFDDEGVKNYASKKEGAGGHKAGTDIYKIQKWLVEFGFEEVGKPDGDFGGKTETAVSYFQNSAKAGLREVNGNAVEVEITFQGEDNGMVDANTHSEMELWKKKSYKKALGPGEKISRDQLIYRKGNYDDTAVEKYNKVKSSGNGYLEGDNVTKIQKLLFKLGFEEVGEADGDYGNKTQTAVENFQKAAEKKPREHNKVKIEVDVSFKGTVNGQVDEETLEELELWDKGKYKRVKNIIDELTLDQIKRIAISGSEANIKKHLKGINQAVKDCGIDTCLKQAHFLAQVIHESGSFRYTSEIGASNDDYGGFKGRGLIQLTFKSNYEKYGKFVGEDFTSSLANKQKLEKDPHAAKSAGWYWSESAKLNDDAESNDFIYITYAINGGYNGFDDRLKWLKKGLSELCSDKNVDSNYSFSESKIYDIEKACFGWGLWFDPNTSKSGCTKNKDRAKNGYQRFISLHDARGTPTLTKKWYGYEADKIRKFAEDRIAALK